MNNNSIKISGFLLMAIMSSFQLAFCEEAAQKSESKPIEESFSYDLSKPYNSFSEEDGWLDSLWGQPFRDHIYLGMWTQHFSSGDDQENTNNLLAVSYKGYFLGTFVNTHKDQVYSAGWQRSLYQDKWGEFDVEAGYRLGLMYGYTKFLRLGDSKFFPLVQTVLDIDYNGFGVELSWAGVIVSAGFYYRF